MANCKTKRFKVELIDGSILKFRSTDCFSAMEKAEIITGKIAVSAESY